VQHGQIFVGIRPDQPRLYLAAATHWTGDGARLAAELLAAHVREVLDVHFHDNGKPQMRFALSTKSSSSISGSRRNSHFVGTSHHP